jgi:hypothetical protein
VFFHPDHWNSQIDAGLLLYGQPAEDEGQDHGPGIAFPSALSLSVTQAITYGVGLGADLGFLSFRCSWQKLSNPRKVTVCKKVTVGKAGPQAKIHPRPGRISRKRRRLTAISSIGTPANRPGRGSFVRRNSELNKGVGWKEDVAGHGLRPRSAQFIRRLKISVCDTAGKGSEEFSSKVGLLS